MRFCSAAIAARRPVDRCGCACAAVAAVANDHNTTAASITARVVVSFIVPSIIPPALNPFESPASAAVVPERWLTVGRLCGIVSGAIG